MRKMVKRFAAALLVLVLGITFVDFSYLPAKAEAAENGENFITLDISYGDVSIDSDGIRGYVGEEEEIIETHIGGSIIILQSDDEVSNYVISISGGTHDIIMKGLDIDGSEIPDDVTFDDESIHDPVEEETDTGEADDSDEIKRAAMSIEDGAQVTLMIEDWNKLTGGNGQAGIYVEEGSSLSIKNTGILKVFGGRGADGIGADEVENCGVISIAGGTAFVVAGNNGVSIGGKPELNDSAFVYTNDSIIPSESSNGYILFPDSEINENREIIKSQNSYVSGEVLLENDLEIVSGDTMTVEKNGALTILANVTLDIQGRLKNEGTVVNNGTINIGKDGEFIQNGKIIYSKGIIQNEGKIYVLSSIMESKVTNNGQIIYPGTVTVSPSSGLWKYYGQDMSFTLNKDYILSPDISISGWNLTVSGEEVGKHKYMIQKDDISGNVADGSIWNIALKNDAPTFEIKQYKTNATVDKDSKWHNKKEVEVEAPDGYLISKGKDSSGRCNWDDSFTAAGLREGENTVYYYLRSDLNDGTKDAIDTTRKAHTIKVDTVAPVINNMEINEESIWDTSAKCIINSKEAGNYYYIVLLADPDDESEIPGKEEIERRAKAGREICCGSSSIDANKDTIINITRLVAETEYKVYAVVKDKAGNLSEVAESEEFTTSKIAIKGSVKITGTAAYGNTLTAVPTVSTANAGELTYSWFRGEDVKDETSFEPIEHANNKTYKITQEDIGFYICVRVEGENCSGYITGNTSMIPKLQPNYTIPTVSSMTYDPSVKLSKIKLPEGWEWANPDTVPSVRTKKYEAVFTPKDDNIYGSVTKSITITIKPKKLSKNMVKNLKSKQYEETAVASDLYLIYQKVKLKKDTDYTISYKNNRNLGTATVTIKGKKNYTGTIKETFEIKKMDIKNLIFIYNSQAIYKGRPLYPTVTIRNGKTKLQRNKDYVVEYKNNTKIGTGRITIKGIGNYRGTKNLKFTITPSRPSIGREGKSPTSFMIRYNAKYGAGNYEISFSTAKSFPKGKTKTFHTKSNVMTIANLDKNTVYYVRVRAYSRISGKRIYGPNSQVMKMVL